MASGDVCHCPARGLRVSSREGLGLLLSVLQWPGQPCPPRPIWPPMSAAPRIPDPACERGPAVRELSLGSA